MWRIIQNAKIAQDTSDPCKTAILVGDKAYPIGGGSWNDLEDKPFGTKTEVVEIVPEQSVEIEEDLYSQLTESGSSFIVGETYTVVFNGVKYECVARKATDYGEEYTLIGNGTVYGDSVQSNNEPFSCDNWGGRIYLNTAEQGVFTISITGPVEIVKQLDPKFLGFGEIVEYIDVIPECMLNGKYVDGYDYYFMRSNYDYDEQYRIYFAMKPNTEYTVIFDGKTYTGISDDGSNPELNIDIEGGGYVSFTAATDGSYASLSYAGNVSPKPVCHLMEKVTTIKQIDSRFVGGADMVIRVDGGPGTILSDENTRIISGSSENVIETFSKGRIPSIKIEYLNDEYTAEVNAVSVQYAYGENIYISFMVYNDGAIFGRRIRIAGTDVDDCWNIVFSGTGQS